MSKIIYDQNETNMIYPKTTKYEWFKSMISQNKINTIILEIQTSIWYMFVSQHFYLKRQSIKIWNKWNVTLDCIINNKKKKSHCWHTFIIL